jgi:DnaJ-domain-containing protein 1
MIDFFAVLGVPRRVWLEAECVKKRFLELSTGVHPDRLHAASETDRQAAHNRFAQLNAAYSCLREPRNRLQHLLQLETKAKPQEIEQIPGDLMEIFLKVGTACRQADILLAERAKTSSALVQVRLFEQSQAQIEELTLLRKQVLSRQEVLLNELRELDIRWGENQAADLHQPEALIGRLTGIYRLLGYFGRWASQLQERIVPLSF